MTSLLDSFLDSLRSPARVHALVVHFPIAAAVFAAMLLAMLAATAGRSAGLRWAATLLLAIGGVAGFLAASTGDTAMAQLDVPLASNEATHHLERHEAMGNVAWLFFLGAAAATALTAVRVRLVRVAALVLALAAGMLTLGWVAVTSHYGGALVYLHGVGVPDTPDNVPPPPRSSRDAEGEGRASEPPTATQPAEAGAAPPATAPEAVEATVPSPPQAPPAPDAGTGAASPSPQ